MHLASKLKKYTLLEIGFKIKNEKKRNEKKRREKKRLPARPWELDKSLTKEPSELCG